ncbi:MAG TPA: class I adenylate-forming enzyme family protein [Methanocorpusculum sp.]|nr:class I adenylate-forming enzyme family protein [Methanocorpusculum sp.]
MTAYRNPSITHFDATPEDCRTLYSIVQYGARHAGDPRAEAILYYGTRILYPELLQTIDEIAAGLCELGVKKGDFVTIFLPNIPQCVIAVYAVNRLGAICNLVHPLSSKLELEHCVSITKSRFILAFEGNEGNCVGLGTKIIRCRTPTYFPNTPKGILMTRIFNHSVRKARKAFDAVEWTALRKAGQEYLKSKPLPEDTGKPEDIAAVMYTGGTTGDSKGVLLSNRALNACATNMMDTIFEGTAHIGVGFLSALPVFHAFGYTLVIHLPLLGGMRIILLPKFDAKLCAKLILKEKIETIPCVPTMFERMYPYLKHTTLPFVRNIAAGGDQVSRELADKYNRILTNTRFRTGYGLTEACGCCILEDGNYTSHPEGCIGKPMNNNDICLTIPGTTTVIPDTEEGELCIHSPSLMSGYYNNPEATDAVLKMHDDGLMWVHTGDVATIDAERNVLFRSRHKRMIKVNGFNVYPNVVEVAMGNCPVIKEVCAVGMNYKTDKRIRLFVTLMDPTMNHKDAKAAIMDYALDHLNRWSCPKEIVIRDVMPLTKMNKIDYKVLEELD